MARRTMLLAALVGLTMLTAGCLELRAATIPDRLLEGPGGNGWQKDADGSQSAAKSMQGGLVKTQTLVYEDRESERGYPGSLSVTTLRTLLRPSETSLVDKVQAAVRAEAEGKGLKIDGEPTTGTRTLKNGATSHWFTYDAQVERSDFFATRNAEVKILGEVWQCASAKTVVVAVGLAQTTDVRTLTGGVRLPSDPDTTTWREIVADPSGDIGGVRGSNGLVHNAQC